MSDVEKVIAALDDCIESRELWNCETGIDATVDYLVTEALKGFRYSLGKVASGVEE